MYIVYTCENRVRSLNGKLAHKRKTQYRNVHKNISETLRLFSSTLNISTTKMQWIFE